MSKKKANKASIVFGFDGHDDMAVPAIEALMQAIPQWVELSKNGCIESKKLIKDVVEAAVAWRIHEEQNRQNGIKSAEQNKSERQPIWDKWQQEAERSFKDHPNWSKAQICEEVGKNNGVTGRAVSERVKNVGKPRKSRS